MKKQLLLQLQQGRLRGAPSEWQFLFRFQAHQTHSQFHGIDYEFGVLENETRTAIQMVHRVGALVVTAAIIAFSFALRNYKALRKSVLTVLALLTIQVALGIINVVMSLPMFAATMHNVVGLALLLSLVNLAHKMFTKENALQN